ncbi:MAG: radical SAM protein [Alphaproteobacteria bacterium]|nr:radical SAM protein [Alphaproteobacteria bacterium]
MNSTDAIAGSALRESTEDRGRATQPAKPPANGAGKLDILNLVFQQGGPGFVQFALNNACNAKCGFCNFALDQLPKENWAYVDGQGAKDALDILYREGIRFMVLTGGEPTLHPNLTEIVRHGTGLGIKMMLVTNAGLLKPEKIHELTDAGVSSFIISIDAADEEVHERNRGLPGVCDKIREANRVCKELKVHTTASVTMSRLVDYDALPDFLQSLGFTSVVFSYPLNYLPGFFLGYRDSDLVTYTAEELEAAYQKVIDLKKRMQVLNPKLSLQEMQRFVRKEEQRHPCLAGYRFFFLDWNLQLWRCHHWEEPMCSIFDFDQSKLVRDGCTRCMINCYRDSSLMQHVAVSVHDGYQALRKGNLKGAAQALGRRANVDSLRAVMEELPWIAKF